MDFINFALKMLSRQSTVSAPSTTTVVKRGDNWKVTITYSK